VADTGSDVPAEILGFSTEHANRTWRPTAHPTRKDAVMIFVAGAIAGGVVGLVASAIWQRRSAGTRALESRSLATAIALLALAVAAVALANSERDRDHATASATATNVTSTTVAPSSTTVATTSTTLGRLVTVPNVSRLARNDAEAALKRAHLQVNIETLPLANVPPGFVLSQIPLPEVKTTAGSTVTLVVSAAA
jgi:beta-lactam-binding protein with PASTA domain